MSISSDAKNVESRQISTSGYELKYVWTKWYMLYVQIVRMEKKKIQSITTYILLLVLVSITYLFHLV